MFSFDIIDVMQYIAFATILFISYILLFSEKKIRMSNNGHYTIPDWNFPLKKFWAERELRKLKNENDQNIDHNYMSEIPKVLRQENSSDSQLIYGSDLKGNSLWIKLTRRRHRISEVCFVLRLQSGKTYTLPVHPDTRVTNSNSRIFDAAGLKLECLVPCSRWRVTFNGELRCGVRDEYSDFYGADEDFKYVRFNFIWAACSDPVYWPYDWNTKLMATSLATEPWRDGNWMHMLSKADSGGYDQFGSLFGQVFIQDYKNEDSMADPIEMNLPGLRQRRWGPHKVSHLHRTGSLFGVCYDGSVFVLGAFSSKSGITHAQFGHLRCPNGETYPIDWMDFHLSNVGETPGELPASQEIRFSANGVTYLVRVHYQHDRKVKLMGGRPFDWMAFNVPVTLGLNGGPGLGITLMWYPCKSDIMPKEPPRVKRLVYSSLKPDPREFVMEFENQIAQSTRASGGKGASIAVLASLLHEKFSLRSFSQYDLLAKNPFADNVAKSQWNQSRSASAGDLRNRLTKKWEPQDKLGIPDFQLPHGFILSTAAFQFQVTRHASLERAIQELEDVCYGKCNGDFETVCQKTVQLFTETPIHDEIATEIVKFIKDHSNLESNFAVRSAGIDEDRPELSSSGTNKSVLGVKGLDGIMTAIQTCWASLYSTASVKYRQQHIQPIATCMAVVIQELVPCEAAGMLFTRDPLTGNPNKLIITANYGIGESVVSGHVDADVYTVRRHMDNSLSIYQQLIGRKSFAIIVDNNVLKKQDLDDTVQNNFVLSSDEIFKLSKIAMALEQMYGASCDIEWGIINGTIHIFQTRPITSLNKITDWELLHEFDTATMSPDDLQTTANVQEVIPGAVSTLSLSIWPKLINTYFTQCFHNRKSHGLFFNDVIVTNQRLMINLYNVFLRQIDRTFSAATKITGVSYFGYDFMTHEMNRVAVHRNGIATKLTKAMALVSGFYNLWQNSKYVGRAEKRINEIRGRYFKENLIKFHCAKELFADLKRTLDDGGVVVNYHFKASDSCSFVQLMAMSVMLEGSEDITTDHYRDISYLLGCNKDVESAQIPMKLVKISQRIHEYGKAEEFIATPADECEKWLEMNCRSASFLFDEFMRAHYHRGFKELDLMSVTWGMNSSDVTRMIQFILKNYSPELKAVNTDNSDVVKKLITPQKFITRQLLTRLLPICQKAVQRRETTKSYLFAFNHEIRMGFRHLSEMMAYEGLLPSRNLIYFLTITELANVIENRDSNLISKALRRQKLFDEWNSLKYPEISKGIPKPLDSNMENVISDYVLNGTPASLGTASGRVCVVKQLSEIENIRAGDVLVTHSIDTAWSPYFPMLSGIVTELGGLISPGLDAVREYGIPCIVGVTNATSLIKTDDTVKLVADSGLLIRVSE